MLSIEFTRGGIKLESESNCIDQSERIRSTSPITLTGFGNNHSLFHVARARKE